MKKIRSDGRAQLKSKYNRLLFSEFHYPIADILYDGFAIN